MINRAKYQLLLYTIKKGLLLSLVQVNAEALSAPVLHILFYCKEHGCYKPPGGEKLSDLVFLPGFLPESSSPEEDLYLNPEDNCLALVS